MATMNAAELKAVVLARADHDDDYRMLLLSDPNTAIAEVAGGSIPDDFTFDLATELALTDPEVEQVTGEMWTIMELAIGSDPCCSTMQ